MKTTIEKISELIVLILLVSCVSLPPHKILPITTPVDIISVPTGIENSFSPDKRLQGTKYVVPYEIVGYLLDSQKMQICLITRELKKHPYDPAVLIMYDLNKNKVLWASKTYISEIKFKDEDVLVQGYRSSWKSFAIDRLTGDVKWQKDFGWGTPLKGDISVSSYPYLKTVQASDVNTGQVLWTRSKIKNEFGWLHTRIFENDFLAVIDGVHKFNFDTGEGWSFEMKTGKFDHGKAIGMSIASGLLGGGPVAPEKISGLASNLLKIDDKVYISASHELYCLNYNTGHEIWHAQLDERKTGEAFLFSHHDKLILINKGNSYREGNYQKYGQPYIAVFDITTGQENSFKELDVESPVKEVYYTKDDGFYLMTSESLMFYDYIGNLKCKFGGSKTQKDIVENNISISRNQTFYTSSKENPDQYYSLYSLKTDSSSLIIQTTNGFSFFDKQCTSDRSFSNEQVNRLFAKTNDFYFLNDNVSFNLNPKNTSDISLKILSSDKRLLGNFKLPHYALNSCKPFVSNSTNTFLFYLNDANSFIIYPLSTLQLK